MIYMIIPMSKIFLIERISKVDEIIVFNSLFMPASLHLGYVFSNCVHLFYSRSMSYKGQGNSVRSKISLEIQFS